MSVKIPYWWTVTTQIWVVLLLLLLVRNLLQPVRSTTQVDIICIEFPLSFLRRHFAWNAVKGCVTKCWFLCPEVPLYVINLFDMLHLVVFGQCLAVLSSYSSMMCRVPLCLFIYQCQDFLQVSLYLIETFKFNDKDDYEIFLVLSGARALTSVILAGKRDSHRHSTTSWS